MEHISIDCPSEKKINHRLSSYGWKPKLESFSVKSRIEREEHKDSAETLHEKISRASARCPETYIELNGVKVKCLLDTGAQVSTISEHFYNEYLSTSELSDTRKILKLSAANKLQIPYLGYILRLI